MMATTKSGIYQIRHIDSGKSYVGSATNIARRWGCHRRELRRNVHHSSHLQRAWNKYGELAFEFLVIEQVPQLDDLVKREQFWMDSLCSFRMGYNVAPKAGTNFGSKRTAETRKKMSAWQIGKKKSPLSVEHRARLSASHIGHIPTTETRKKMSESAKRNGAPKLTEDQRARSIASRRGAKRTPEQKARISAGLVGKPRSAETRAKIKASWQRRRASQFHGQSEAQT